MKFSQVFFLFIILFCSCQEKSNESYISKVKVVEMESTIKILNRIDSLITEEDVKDFLVSQDSIYLKEENIVFGFNTVYNFFHKKVCKVVYDNLEVKPYFKGDIDNNGYTDIGIMYYELKDRYELMGGQIFVIILGKPNNEFELIRPYSTYYFKDKTNCSSFELGCIEQLRFLGLTLKKENIPAIFHDYEPLDLHEEKSDNTIRKRDTLIFWKNNLIEYNPNPSKHKIQEIKVNFLGSSNDDICCNPHFDIRYTQDSIYYHGRMWIENSKKETKNNRQEFEELCEMLNYIIDFSKPEQDLRQSEDIETNYILEITYDDNKKIKVIDGQSCSCSFSSFGLDIFYDKILQTKFVRRVRHDFRP